MLCARVYLLCTNTPEFVTVDNITNTPNTRCPWSGGGGARGRFHSHLTRVCVCVRVDIWHLAHRAYLCREHAHCVNIPYKVYRLRKRHARTQSSAEQIRHQGKTQEIMFSASVYFIRHYLPQVWNHYEKTNIKTIYISNILTARMLCH